MTMLSTNDIMAGTDIIQCTCSIAHYIGCKFTCSAIKIRATATQHVQILQSQYSHYSLTQ